MCFVTLLENIDRKDCENNLTIILVNLALKKYLQLHNFE